MTVLTYEKIKEFMDRISQAIAKNNTELAIIAAIEFGEYLHILFPGKKLEEILNSLKTFQEQFADYPVPAMLIPRLIQNANARYYEEHIEDPQHIEYNVAHTLTDLYKGITGFEILLNENQLREKIEEINLAEMESAMDNTVNFLKDDLIPNSPARIKMNLAIDGIVRLAEENKSTEKIQNPLDQLAKNLKADSIAYYADPHKNEEKTKNFQKASKSKVSIVDKVMEDLQPAINWKIVINNVVTAIEAITTLGFSLIAQAIENRFASQKTPIFGGVRIEGIKTEGARKELSKINIDKAINTKEREKPSLENQENFKPKP